MMQDSAVKSMGVGPEDQGSPLDPNLVSLMQEEVTRVKGQNLPVNRAFEAVAAKSGLKFNTVRNYYYRYLHEKDKKQKVSDKEDDNKNKGGSVAGNTFTEKEVKVLMMNMLQGQAEGQSVRGCAKHLANQDPRLMLRYQNKYRNIISTNPEYVNQIMEEMSIGGGRYYNPFTKKVVESKETVVNEELLDIISQLVSNIGKIQGKALESFFKGLLDLSEMAICYKQLKDSQTHEKSTSISPYAGELEYQRKGISHMMIALHQLMGINRKFINLPSVDKLSKLPEYTRELEMYIKEYDRGIAY